MTTKVLLEIIQNGDLEPNMVYKSEGLEILEQFTNTRETLLDIYQVRNDMFSSVEYREYSSDDNVYEGLENVVSSMGKSKSSHLLFIEVKTEDNDEISLIFQENDSVFLGYIYIHQ